MKAPAARILVVDDEPEDGRLIEALLLPEGYITIQADNGEAALAAIAEQAPDLVLVDIMMPGMNGYELTRRLRSDPLTAEIPIIILTAHTDRDARIKGLEAGAEDFLSKPIDRVELWLRIRNLLRLRDIRLAILIAREEADRANRAKSDFLSRMSHELRTPLNAVLGFSQMLLMDDLLDEHREVVGFIQSAGRHLLHLVNDILDIAAIEAGAPRISLESVSVADVVVETIDLVRGQAHDRGVVINPPGDDIHAFVVADRQSLLQILLNLLSNAAKYNRPGGEISIACAQAGPNLSISVTDTGIGMTAENLTKLFSPFERLGAEQTDIEGTGIGLILSRALSHNMAGTLTAASTIGAGSTFTLVLPKGETTEQALDSEDIGAITKQPDRQAITILCIEDNVVNIRLIEAAMRRIPNVKLVTAIQGQIGLDLAKQIAPDMILLDLQLPDIPGDEILRRLRSRPATTNTPIVITSAHASPHEVERLLALGATAYLTKPIDIRQLLAHVETAREAIVTPTSRLTVATTPPEPR